MALFQSGLLEGEDLFLVEETAKKLYKNLINYRAKGSKPFILSTSFCIHSKYFIR